MNPFLSSSRHRWFLLLLVAALAGVGTAQADRSRVSFSIGVNVPHGGRDFYHGSDRYYAYRGEYYRWDRGRYYRCPPPRGYYVSHLPRHSVRVVVGSDVYYRADHIYYRPSGARYEIVEVPVVQERIVVRDSNRVIGAPSTPATPAPRADEPLAVWRGDERFVLEGGQYFKPTSQGLVHAPTPVGALLKSLPIGAMTVWHDENEYFEFDGGYFRRSPDGFKVVEVPWAAESKAPEPAAGA